MKANTIGKSLYKSNTIQLSAAVTLSGILLYLELLIGAFDVTQLPPEVAVWAAPIVVLLGLIIGALRVKTGLPLKGTKAARQAAVALDITEQAHYDAGLLKGKQ